VRMRSRQQLYRDAAPAGGGQFPAWEELPSNQWLELAIFGDWGKETPPFHTGIFRGQSNYQWLEGLEDLGKVSLGVLKEQYLNGFKVLRFLPTYQLRFLDLLPIQSSCQIVRIPGGQRGVFFLENESRRSPIDFIYFECKF